jgi:uncharacterized protein DUF6766
LHGSGSAAACDGGNPPFAGPRYAWPESWQVPVTVPPEFGTLLAASSLDSPHHLQEDNMATAGTAARTKKASEEPTFLRRMWRDYSLSITVFAMFATSFILHVIFGWWQYVADQTSQGQDPTLWGWSGYWVYFGEWTFQNWQSEFLEVFVLIVLTAFLVHKGSHESKDGEEEMKASLARIERRLDQLTKERES